MRHLPIRAIRAIRATLVLPRTRAILVRLRTLATRATRVLHRILAILVPLKIRVIPVIRAQVQIHATRALPRIHVTHAHQRIRVTLVPQMDSSRGVFQ